MMVAKEQQPHQALHSLLKEEYGSCERTVWVYDTVRGRSKLTRRGEGRGTARGRMDTVQAKLHWGESPQRILSLGRDGAIGQRHPDLFPLSLLLPLVGLSDAGRFLLQHDGDAWVRMISRLGHGAGAGGGGDDVLV